MVIDDLDDDLRLYLGPSRSGSLLEVIVVVRKGEHPELAIHAMPMRAKYRRLFPGGWRWPRRTRSGEPITEELLEKLAAKAEEGFDVEEILRRRGGRPAMGSSAASVESVRLDPELSKALRERAEREGRTNSELIRDALSRYLQAT